MDYPVRSDMGAGGKFIDGNPGSGIPASLDLADDQNQVYDELIALVSDAGITPDHATRTQVRDAIRKLASEFPLAALPYPTVDTSDNEIGATVASATAGGTVSIPADVWVTVGEELVSGETGRLRSYKTTAWTSADLDASSTYYLRAQVQAGALVPYVQKGTDGDSIPASLIGTAGGGSGGGFDSTVLDVLLAKVVTGVAASTPTITNLANSKLLRFAGGADHTASTSADANRDFTFNYVLNWARTPTAVGSCGFDGPAIGSTADRAYDDVITPSRYDFDHDVHVSFDPGGTFSMTLHSRVLATA